MINIQVKYQGNSYLKIKCGNSENIIWLEIKSSWDYYYIFISKDENKSSLMLIKNIFYC